MSFNNISHLSVTYVGAQGVRTHAFVCRKDVKGYYANIDQSILTSLVSEYVHDSKVLALVDLYLRRFVATGNEYVDIKRGISLGCPLSLLMGALYLKPLDDRMAALGCFYVRFMDDWVVLVSTRWKLRKAVKAINEELTALRVEKSPEKTFIGRIAKRFDFLGYWFSRVLVFARGGGRGEKDR